MFTPLPSVRWVQVPLRNKVLAAASAGALGVVIGDNSKRCDAAFDQVCVRGSDQANGA